MLNTPPRKITKNRVPERQSHELGPTTKGTRSAPGPVRPRCPCLAACPCFEGGFSPNSGHPSRSSLAPIPTKVICGHFYHWNNNCLEQMAEWSLWRYNMTRCWQYLQPCNITITKLIKPDLKLYIRDAFLINYRNYYSISILRNMHYTGISTEIFSWGGGGGRNAIKHNIISRIVIVFIVHNL